MSAENELQQPQPDVSEPEHHLTQAERDEEIAAIQQHSKHQHPGIDAPARAASGAAAQGSAHCRRVLLVLLLAGVLSR